METLKNITAVVLAAILIASLIMNMRYYNRFKHCETVASDTDIVTFIDTIPYYKPAPTKETFVKKDVSRLPVATTVGNEDTTVLPMLADSVEVSVPITQKIYEDSTCTAFVSGYKQSLDSIFVRPRREVVTITNTVDKTSDKRGRWGIGIQVGYGVTTASGANLSPYIGIGITYNLITF